MTDNVILFPSKTNANIFPSNVEESIDHLEQIRKDYCDEVADDAVEAIFAVFSSYGIFINKPDESSIKNIVFLEEAVKSLLYSIKNVPHAFQEIADSCVTIDGEAREELERLIDEVTT
jgi:hypothetical protein